MKKNLFIVFLSIVLGTSIEARSQTTATTTLLSYSHQHTFSDLKRNDTFTITLNGKSIITGDVIFKIKDYNNKNIYVLKFKAEDLLRDMADVLNKRQQQDTIKARMRKFFDETSYTSPAIKSNDKFDTDNSTKDVWNDIKSDRAAIGFLFSYGYEGTYGIAYSKKKHQVVTYFYSD